MIEVMSALLRVSCIISKELHSEASARMRAIGLRDGITMAAINDIAKYG
jgi:hypothetical protein